MLKEEIIKKKSILKTCENKKIKLKFVPRA
jgi:hypothetical protein